MKYKINHNGILSIERKGVLQSQRCPFTTQVDELDESRINAGCGDWCPHFGEPTQFIGGNGNWSLELCHKRIINGQFMDERTKE